MTSPEFWDSQREAMRLMGDIVQRTGLKALKTLHSKAAGASRLALCLYETEDGQHVYGVEENDILVFTGTKAEAKNRYGRKW